MGTHSLIQRSCVKPVCRPANIFKIRASGRRIQINNSDNLSPCQCAMPEIKTWMQIYLPLPCQFLSDCLFPACVIAGYKATSSAFRLVHNSHGLQISLNSGCSDSPKRSVLEIYYDSQKKMFRHLIRKAFFDTQEIFSWDMSYDVGISSGRYLLRLIL